jgi:hypothetical protein
LNMPSLCRRTVTIIGLLLTLASVGTADASCNSDLQGQPFYSSLAHLSPHAQQQWAQVLKNGGQWLKYGLERIRKSGMTQLEFTFSDYEESGYFNRDFKYVHRDPSLGFEHQLVYLQNRLRGFKGTRAGDHLISEDDIIQPGFLFVDSQKEIILLPYAAEVAADLHVASEKEIGELVEPERYTEMLADGFQIVQVSQKENEFSFTQHDLGHLIGFSRDAVYMRAVRQLARQRAALSPERRKDSTEDREAMAAFYVFEVFSRGNLPALKTFFTKIGIPEAMDCESRKCLNEKLKPKYWQARELYPKMRLELIDLFGGSVVGGQSFNYDGYFSPKFDPVMIELQGQPWGNRELADILTYLLLTAKLSIPEQVRMLVEGDLRLRHIYDSYFHRMGPTFGRLIP